MNSKEILERAAALQESKRHDYTADASLQFENFERVSSVVAWFKDPIDQTFVALLMTKVARLAALLGNKSPKNESVEDTFVDGTNYFSLWGGKRLEKDSIWTVPYHNQIANYTKDQLINNLLAAGFVAEENNIYRRTIPGVSLIVDIDHCSRDYNIVAALTNLPYFTKETLA